MIGIADGRKTVQEDRQRHVDRHAREREERETDRAYLSERWDNQPEKSNENNKHTSKPACEAVEMIPQQEVDGKCCNYSGLN